MSNQSRTTYLPFGLPRTDAHVPPISTTDVTDLAYTGQRDLDSQNNAYSLGLMDYKARFYDPYVYRFTQPDTIIPDQTNSQAWNRYSYVENRPIVLNDPTGHTSACDGDPDYVDPDCPEEDNSAPSSPGTPPPPSIPPDPTTDSEGEDEQQVIILNPLLAFGLVPEQWYQSPSYSFEYKLLQEFCAARFGEGFICQLPPMPDCVDCIPLPEWWQYVDKQDMLLDSVGLVVDVTTFGIGGRVTKFLELGGKALDQTDALIGVTQVIKDTKSQSADWYTYGSFATDVGGLFMPIVPDIAGIVINIIHAHELANRNGH